MPSIYEQPNSNTADSDSGNERIELFSVAHRNTAPPFEMRENFLKGMSKFIQIFTVFTQLFPIVPPNFCQVF